MSPRRLLLPFLLALAPLALRAATLTVTSTADTINPDGACTLREAMTAAITNTTVTDCGTGTAGLDTIRFSIGGGGVQTITLAASLPIITDPVVIDGTSQTGYSGTPLIEVSGSGVPTAFTIAATGGGSTIKGLAIIRFSGDAISIQAGANGNTIASNSIGRDASGAFASNSGNGITVQDSSGNTISGNTIGNNTLTGLVMTGAASNIVQANIFARNQQGGIVLQSSLLNAANDNIIGATTTGGPGGNSFQFNNTTLYFSAGIVVLSGVRNRLSMNTGFMNLSKLTFVALIDLGGDGDTPNDPCDPDSGANMLQNTPIFTRSIATSTNVQLAGTFNSTASTTFTLEFYLSDPNTFGEPTQYLGSTTVTTDASCNATFNLTFPVVVPPSLGIYRVTAVAIDPQNNTSETAPARHLAFPIPVTKSFSPTTVAVGSPSTLTVTFTGPNGMYDTAGLTFTDTYPAGLVNASSPAPQSTCGGTVTATPGTNTLTLTGGVVPGFTNTCTVTATVIAQSAGSFVNTIPAGAVDATDEQGPNEVPASATLTAIVLPPPTVAKSFAPTSIAIAGASRLTITLTNPSATPISGATFTDSYPANLVNAVVPNVATTCGGTATATAGGSSLALSGGTIPANGSCTVAVTLSSAVVNNYTNTLPANAVTSTNASPSSTSASASLNVTLLPAPTIAKTFAAPQSVAGQPATLIIWLTNPSGAPVAGAAFTDTYPANLVNASAPNASTNCGGSVTAAPGGSSVALSGGTIPASSGCSVIVSLTSNTAGVYTNTIPAGALTSTNANPSTTPATAQLQVLDAATIPALSPLALLALAIALAIAAAVVLRS